MDLKPRDLAVGVIDLFAVLLPGAVLVFLALDEARARLFGTVLPAISGEVQGWAVFLFASYLLGHFIFLLGSFLDPVYDRVRRRAKPAESDWLYRAAKEEKRKVLGDDNQEIVNTFKWAKAMVQLRYPAAATEIARLEADSKFFRSFVVVLLLILLRFVGKLFTNEVSIQTALELVICAALLVLSFWRYFDQRWKSTQLAYTYLMALGKMPERDVPHAPADDTDAP
jgi:hypothetical protein